MMKEDKNALSTASMTSVVDEKGVMGSSSGTVSHWFSSSSGFDDAEEEADDNASVSEDFEESPDFSLLVRVFPVDIEGANVDETDDETDDPTENCTLRRRLQCLACRFIFSQLAVTMALFNVSHVVLKRWQRDRCVVRPPPYSFDEDGELVLKHNLNHVYMPDSTISATTLWITVVWLPLILVSVAAWFLSTSPSWRSACCCFLLPRIMEVVAAAGGLLSTTAVTESITRLLKTLVGRRRPNFYGMCQFDASTLECLSDKCHICEAQYSFPSGHSSMSMAGTMFLTCYFGAKINSYYSGANKSSHLQQRRRCWIALQAMFFLGWTFYVGATRVVDHFHNPTDVAAGLLLGASTAVAVYHVYFPPMWKSPVAGTPRSVLRLTAEATASSGLVHHYEYEVPHQQLEAPV